MFLEIITPDEKIFEGEVHSAIFPGSKGAFQVLNHHAPLVSTLGKGGIKIVKTIDKKPKKIYYEIDGGVVEVLNNKIQVLAEAILD